MPEQMIAALSEDPKIAMASLLGGLGILGGVSVAISTIIMINLRKMRQSEDINALKQSMLDQGLSADEIAKVIHAVPKRGFSVDWHRPRQKC